MVEEDIRDIVYLRGYTILVLILSIFSAIVLIATDFAWWENGTVVHVRLSSTFRLSILIILPLFLGFIACGTIACLMLFTEIGNKKKLNRIILWITIYIFSLAIIAAGVLWITFSKIATIWAYGAGFYGSIICSIIIPVLSLVYLKVKQEIQT